jgi:hypothetical protein
MQKDTKHKVSPLNAKPIIVGMVLMFIIVHVGFHASYIKHFPEFTKFNWIHHIHGALMGSWVFLLVLQPLLIHKRKFAAHRLLGKLSYAIVPLIAISMVLVAKENYQSGILKKTAVDVMATQSITWMQLMLFVLFYSLAIYYRKLTDWHMRFMIGIAIIMIGPPMNRILVSYFPGIGVANILVMVLYLKTTVAAALFLSDIVKKKNWTPYFIVLIAFLFSDIVYHARYSEAWQSLGRFIIANLY